MEFSYGDYQYYSSTIQTPNFYYFIENPLRSYAALKIQKNWRGFYIRKTNAVFIKQMKYRVHVITELVKSEESYVKDLTLLLKNCYYPLKEQLNIQDKAFQPIVTQGELEALFTNIVSIYEFNSTFCSALQQEFVNLRPYSKISQVLIKFAAKFSIYYLYTAKCETVNRTLEHLRRSSKRFRDFLSQVEYTGELRDMDLWSFLIKPVQRITKYPLLLTQLLKHTPNSHPDYDGVKEALKTYKKINEENNVNIGRYEKTIKMIEYQEVYSSRFNVPIYRSDRTIILEIYVASPQNANLKWKLIILTDLVLIISKDCDQKANDRYIELDKNSVVKDLPDSKYFLNLFSISGGNAGETFQAENNEEKMHIMHILDQTIEMVGRKNGTVHLGTKSNVSDDKKTQAITRENSNIKVEVQVVGTEQRFKDGLYRTYYVILISLGRELFHKCFKRHSEIRHIYKLLSQTYPMKRFPMCEKKSMFLKTFSTKTVEMRKLFIENFLQMALQDIEFRSCQIIQDFIKFPIGFLDNNVHQEVSGCVNYHKAAFSNGQAQNTPIRNSNSIRPAKDTFPANSEANHFVYKNKAPNLTYSKTVFPRGVSRFSHSNAVFADLNIRDTSRNHQRQMPLTPENHLCTSVPELKSVNQKSKYTHGSCTKKVYDVKHLKHDIVVFLLNGSSFEFEIDCYTSANYICEQISIQLGLEKHDDFRLFVTEAINRERPLDRDECIVEALSLVEERTMGMLTKMSKSVINIFREESHQKLIFKKYYYLASDEERKLYQKDSVRLDLLASQALLGIREFCNHFEHNKILTIMCLAACNKYSDDILRKGARAWFHTVNKKIFFEFIPESVIKIKSKEFWKTGLQNFWETISSQVGLEPINNNLSFAHDMSNLKTIIQHQILNLLCSSSYYGMAFYKAKVYSPNETTSSRNWPSNKFILGIKYDELVALSSTKTKCYLLYKLKDVVDIRCYPLSIKLFFTDYEIRLDTKKSFEIQQMIETYKKLQEIGVQDEKEYACELERLESSR